MQLNLTLDLTLNLRWNQDENVDYSMLRLSRCPGTLPYYGHCSVIIRRWCSPPWSLSQLCQPFLLSLLSSDSLFGLQRPFQTILLFSVTSDPNRHSDATYASLRIEDRAFTQPLCSQAIHIRCRMHTICTWSDLLGMPLTSAWYNIKLVDRNISHLRHLLPCSCRKWYRRRCGRRSWNTHKCHLCVGNNGW